MGKRGKTGEHNLGRTGKKCNGWKGGTTMSNGYKYIHKPEHPNSDKKGYVKKCVLKMSNHLNRPLKKGEIVHHVDENKLNDSIKNLKIVTRSEHIYIHNPHRWKKQYSVECAGCGIIFMPKRPPRCKLSYCSRECCFKHKKFYRH